VAPETELLMREMVLNGEVDALIPERVWREMERSLGESHPEVFFDTLQRCGALKVVLPELLWSESQRLVLLRSVQIAADKTVRFACVLSDLAPEPIAALCERLRVPAEYRDLALLMARFGTRLLRPRDAADLLEVFEHSDAFRRPERFEKLLLAVQARGDVDSRIASTLAAAASVALPKDQMAALKGPAIAAAVRAARLQQISRLMG
jgi:tRNA nucleotidyltransferase (CCA-adding enzyme)